MLGAEGGLSRPRPSPLPHPEPREADPPIRPLLRGISHLVVAPVALGLGVLLVISAPTVAAKALTGVYALSLVALFATSAALHRVSWSPRARTRMRRADHSTIFVFIAGSCTVILGLGLPPADAIVVLSFVWAGAVVGVVLQFFFLDAPRFVVTAPYLLLGWGPVVVLPELAHHLGGIGFALLLGGGALYSLGAVVYARRRPDPSPTYFGFHEVFHALTIAAASCHLALIAFVIFPALRAHHLS